MTVSLSDDQVRFLRLRAQRLSPLQPDTVAALVQALGGFQAQDMPAAALALRVRSAGLVADEVQRALVKERVVVRTWAMRGTLHLLATKDLGWLLPLLGPVFLAASRRRCAELGLDEETLAKGVCAIRDALASQGPLTRPELVEYLDARGIPTEGQAKAYLVYHAALEGFVCFGPDRRSKPTYVLLDDWIQREHASVLSREEACAELARRYLAAYAPAGPEDLAAWSGLTVSEARAAWGRIAGGLMEVEFAHHPLWLLKSSAAWLDEFPASTAMVRLLPAFDTYLLGYQSRNLVVAPQHAKRVNAGGGMVRPALLVNGQVMGTWKSKRQRSGLDVVIEPFHGLAPETLPGLEAEVKDLGRFLGTRATLKMLAPLAH